MRSATAKKRMSASPSTVMFAVEVNPFLLFDSLSLILFDFVIVFTIDMLEICTDAQPILNRAGRVMYQAD